MLTNCFRFAPRDSVPGLIAKICKYLKDHPGWSEEELEEQIKQFIGQTGVESFNGRTGAVVLDESDVNNLKIASAYFAEGVETIDKLDLVTLYNQGVRFVFTNWNSVTSGYDLSFVLDYFSGSNDVVYYPMATGSGSGGNIISVNGKTGIVELSLSDILGDSGAQVKLCTATEFTSTTLSTWNAYYKDGYRVIGVVNSDASAIDYIYLLRQDENNHQPIGLSAGASDAYTPANPPPYPVESVNGKTGVVTGLYSAENPPPYPVVSVNGKTGNVIGLYSEENTPPYPVVSVNGYTGKVIVDKIESSIGVAQLLVSTDERTPTINVRGKGTYLNREFSVYYDDEEKSVIARVVYPGLYDKTKFIKLYSEITQPPYPVTSVDGKTGNINSARIISGSTYPLTIGQSSGIVALVANISGSTLPVGNTATYEILFDKANPVPIAASFMGGGYSLQISVVRSASNKSFYVNITNHGFEGEISLNGSLVVAFIPNGATSVTGVSNA